VANSCTSLVHWDTLPTVIWSGPQRSGAKFWLDPVRVQGSRGFNRAEIRRIERLVADNAALPRAWHEYFGVNLGEAIAQSLSVTDDALVVDLTDGRTITVPLVWFPRLLHGTPDERTNWRLIGNGGGIHWPGLDEDISVESLLAGRDLARLRSPSGDGSTRAQPSPPDLNITTLATAMHQSSPGSAPAPALPCPGFWRDRPSGAAVPLPAQTAVARILSLPPR
jgi:hypothetical protein